MKKQFSTILLIFIFFVGLSVLLYPSISDYVNQKNQSRAVANYEKTAEQLSKQDTEEIFQKAEDYNSRLEQAPGAFYDPSQVDGYEKILDITGTGIMGYISIPKINVELPIYHGTDEGVLQIACGHLEGSSLPIGGASTHAVLSAHRGLPSAKLFTNLDKMEIDDTFTITILNRVLTYQVDEISIVLPSEVDKLQIEEGKDYCTLMTCTPYGINTHRLLVRGHRIETSEEKNTHVTADAFQIEPIVIAPVLAAPMLVILLIWILFHTRKKKKKR